MNPSLSRSPILDVVFHGPIKLFLDAQTGAMVKAVDRISNKPAEQFYRAAYVAHAKAQARAAWESRADR